MFLLIFDAIQVVGDVYGLAMQAVKERGKHKVLEK